MTSAVKCRRGPDQDIASAARKALEGEIASHANAIIELKGRLNAMTPIFKLPTELISEIFVQVAIDHYVLRQRPTFGSALAYKWITLSHVCRAWRDIALNTPRLWSRIVLTRFDVTEAVLARSKKAPLWVTANITYTDDSRAKLLDLIMKEPHRLKEFRVSGPGRILQGLASKWRGQADLLETISLSDSNAYDPRSALPYNPVIPTLFSGHTPSLRGLDIHRIVVTWNNPLFCSTLTSLVVVSRYDSTPQLGSFSELLTALHNMGALESLELNEAIPRLPEDSTTLPGAQRTVTLPRLRRLTLLSDVIDCANLLNHMSLPPNTRMVVTGRTEKGVQELVRVFGEHLARSSPLLTARLSPVYSAQIYVKGWRSVVEASYDDVPDVELYLDAFPHSRSLQHLMSEATFFSQVHRLEILPSFTAWEWEALFKRTQELRTLCISGHPEDGLLRALSVVRRTDDQRDALPAPKLSAVEMSSVRFGCLHSNHDSEYLDEMLDWLMLRCHYGVPIQRLKLSMCINASADDIDLLEEVVVAVDWDGEETLEDDEYDGPTDDDPYDDDILHPFHMDWHDLYDDDEMDYWMIPFGF